MLIAGVDEVGRGPLAGPVVAAAVTFKKGYKHSEIRDSKKLSHEEREQLVPIIKRDAVAWSIIAVGHERIKYLNIRSASKLAMSLAIRRVPADLVLIDGNMEIDTEKKQRTIIGGDNLHVEISAASIIAKVWRDALMKTLDLKYPGYGFGKHSGYATKFHRDAIKTQGPCRVHRITFAGVKEYANGRSTTAIIENQSELMGSSTPEDLYDFAS